MVIQINKPAAFTVDVKSAKGKLDARVVSPSGAEEEATVQQLDAGWLFVEPYFKFWFSILGICSFDGDVLVFKIVVKSYDKQYVILCMIVVSSSFCGCVRCVNLFSDFGKFLLNKWLMPSHEFSKQ